MFQQELSDGHRDQYGNTPLHRACVHGQLDIVQLLACEVGCDPNNTNNEGLSCLHLAAQHGHLPLVRYLVEEVGSDVTLEDEHGRSPTSLSAGRGHLHIFKYLIEEKGADPQFKTSKGWKTAEFSMAPGRSLVHTASREGHLHVVRYLVEHHGCDPSCRDDEGLTPLHLACRLGHMEIVSYLIAVCHCDPNCTSHNGTTCLHAARGNLQVIKYLHINHSCQIKFDSYGLTPLHYAAYCGKLDGLIYLIEDMNCDPYSRGLTERTPLHYASEGGHLGVVKYLVQTHHCNPLCAEEDRQTSLHRAAAKGHLEVVRYFMLSLGCNLMVRDKYNNTPLHSAVISKQLEVLKFLIENMNCDPNIRGQFGMTPLHLALTSKYFGICMYLIDLPHCDVLAKVSAGRVYTNPLHLAVETENLEIVAHLCNTRRLNPNLQPKLLEATDNLDILDFLQNYMDPLNRAAKLGDMETVKHYVGREKWDPNELDKDGNNTLHIAAQHGQLEVVKYLTEGLLCDPNCKGQLERTPLHHASAGGHFDVVKYFIDTYHCDPLCPDGIQRTPLHGAAAENNLNIVKYFTNTLKCNPAVVDCNDNTPLHLASLYGHLEVVKFLLEDKKCDPNSEGHRGGSPLHYASENGHLEIVQYLVETQHCDPLCQDEGNNTPLHKAAAKGQLEVIRHFANMPCCHAIVKNSRKNTPLNVAVSCDHLEVVKVFIESMNYDPNVRGHLDMTPLHSSLRHRNFGIAKYLISLPKCDVLAKVSHDNLPTNALHLAVETQNLEIISYLCNTRRFDPQLQPDREKLLEAAEESAVFEFLKSFTDPLHYAAVYGDVERVRHYVEKEKWDPLKLDRYGNNTLHNAAQHGQLEVVKYLTGLSKDPINEYVEILCDPLVKNRYGLTAQDIASQNGHRHVVSYLLRAASNQPVLQQDVISPPLNLFVVGNSGSGKSTLVKALSAENSLLGRIIKVKDVTPLTAGIVPTTLHSQMIGEVNFYDFAGHEEYYASHEMILCQTTQPLVLLTVNISLPEEEIQKQILYWLTMLSSSCSTDAVKTIHVVIVGSHADQIKFKGKKDNYVQVSSLVSEEYSLKYHGVIQCDCRYPTSDNLNQLRLKLSTICRSIRLFLADEDENSNSLCAALMHHLKQNKSEQVTTTVSELHKSITDSFIPGSRIVPLIDQMLLLDSCKKLSSNGHVLFLPHDDNEMESVLVLDKHTILARVHASLQVRKDLTNEFGVVEEEHLKSFLSSLLEGMMKPEQAVRYLLFSQFCTEITANQLISVPQSIKGVVHYFFPNLVSASRQADSMPLGDADDGYTHLYTWGLKCTNRHQFLTPRYLHSLFVQLTKCEGDIINARFNIWKNGILLVNNNGTRSIIEVTDQTTRLYLKMQCVKGCELHLVKQRSKLISLIKSLLDKVCPKVKFSEFLLLPQTTFPLDYGNEIPLADVALSVIYSRPTVLFGYNNVPITELLYFDPFHAIEELTLQVLFRHCQCMDVLPSSTFSTVRTSIKGGCEELTKALLDQTAIQEITYNQLYRELLQYSIFTDGDLYTLADITISPCDKTNDSESELLSVSSMETLTISDLHLVNVNLVNVAHPVKIGHALGLKHSTLEKISRRYLCPDHCFTEVLAAWLEREDSPSPNWGEVIAALKSADMSDLACQLVKKLAKADYPQDCSETSNLVDNSELSPDNLREVAEYVRDLDHKWFHLGLSLGLRYSTLKNIEASPHHHEVGDHMNGVLKNWLDSKGVRGSPSWRFLAQALDCPLVRGSQAARRIQKEHQITQTLLDIPQLS